MVLGRDSRRSSTATSRRGSSLPCVRTFLVHAWVLGGIWRGRCVVVVSVSEADIERSQYARRAAANIYLLRRTEGAGPPHSSVNRMWSVGVKKRVRNLVVVNSRSPNTPRCWCEKADGRLGEQMVNFCGAMPAARPPALIVVSIPVKCVLILARYRDRVQHLLPHAPWAQERGHQGFPQGPAGKSSHRFVYMPADAHILQS